MSLRIVFMGTPEFAVPSLKILVENGYDIVGVITATDKMGGRGGHQILTSAVKKYALETGLKILQPEKLRNPEFIRELRSLNADLQVVVAFRMLPEIVWDMPGSGTFNLHGSLLPKYRGAAPINWAVINGETETGVTTFFIRHEIDTGDVIFQERTPIGPDETAGELHDRMMDLGAQLVLKTVRAIESGDYRLHRQDPALACPAPKLSKETGRINFNQSARAVHNFIRGLSPFPGAWTVLDDLELKILRSRPVQEPHPYPSGRMVTDEKTYIKFAAADGFVEILELQLQGRKRMDAADFVRGYRFLSN
ncbi:MAG TPA: methionyl-tRNA formyltransferase [Flavilitoribacter sp.]|nr:methionyl-tRNA formyltransferase [Flavilitoribacter sp.]HMQ86204.1 methionyl-tRNA formyltransferase [Flavilitoribacter sp.]